MAVKKEFEPMEDRHIIISGSEDINIDPVYINTSISGQVADEYEEIGLVLAASQSGGRIAKKQVDDVHKKVENIINLAKEAIRQYVSKKDEKKKEELKNILRIVKKAKSAEKVIDMKYMLESDAPESAERRRLLTGWTREESEKDGKESRMREIDVPLLDVEDLLNNNGEDR